MTKKPVQPERKPVDGPIGVKVLGDWPITALEISVEHNGHKQKLTISAYNAFRLFRTLAEVLTIPLSRWQLKNITLGNKVTATIGFPTKTLGDKVAAYLVAKELKKQGIIADVEEEEEAGES